MLRELQLNKKQSLGVVSVEYGTYRENCLLTVLYIQMQTIILHNNTVTVLLIGMCLFVACSSRIKVQSLVDFNEVPAEEKLPLVCQITFGIPCMPLSHHRSIAPTILYFIPVFHDII